MINRGVSHSRPPRSHLSVRDFHSASRLTIGTSPIKALMIDTTSLAHTERVIMNRSPPMREGEPSCSQCVHNAPVVLSPCSPKADNQQLTLFTQGEQSAAGKDLMNIAPRNSGAMSSSQGAVHLVRARWSWRPTTVITRHRADASERLIIKHAAHRALWRLS